MVDAAAGTGAGARPAGRRRSGEVLQGLIVAGVSQARAGGPDAVVLREATRTVGVSPNAAYRHFDDRDDLLAAVAREATALLAARMQHNIDAVRAQPGTAAWARARLRAVGEAYLAFARDEPGLFRTAFSAPGRPHEARVHRTGERHPSRTPLEILDNTLDELVTTGALPASRRSHATALAWSAVHGLATLRLAGVFNDDGDDLDDVLDQFIQRGL